jgi:hypothetical protein
MIMSLRPYLTDEEIVEICHPLLQPAAQVRYLRNHLGLVVKTKPNGRPLVSRAHFETAIANSSPSTAKPPADQSLACPDADALVRLMKGKKLDYANGQKEKKQPARVA